MHACSVQLYSLGEPVSTSLAEYLASGNITSLQQQQAECVKAGSCSQAQFGACGKDVGGSCSLHGILKAVHDRPRLSMVMRASPSPDWHASLHPSICILTCPKQMPPVMEACDLHMGICHTSCIQSFTRITNCGGFAQAALAPREPSPCNNI
jgi:hypothetical protein